MWVVAALAPVAVARPGGGGHYSGGGHSGGGGGGHSYSGGHSSYSHSHSGGGDTSWGQLVAIGTILAVFYGVSAYNKRRDAPPSEVDTKTWIAKIGLGVDELRARDPGFDVHAFEARCERVMAEVNAAWVAGDMGSVRALVSDGVYVRFRTYLALLAARGKHNVMSDWRARSARVIACTSSEAWDAVDVQIEAEARDLDLPIALGPDETQRKLARAPLEPYTEVWSFLRRRGRTTAAGGTKGALEGACAACGAPQPRTEVVKCASCGALTNSGEYDWVLAEITQEGEWSPGSDPVLRFDQLISRDPSVSAEALEDRASVMFWKWIEARVTGDRRRLERFCAVAGEPPAPRADLSEVAVGSCEVTLAQPDVGGRDRVIAAVRWSARWKGRPPTNQVTELILVRPTGAKTPAGLSCLDCPHCGGPLADSDDVTCRFCGESLTGSSSEWLLAEIGGDPGPGST